ncbi:DUF1015 domain-containing protein [candidate division WOR-3 bacterium]|nr:DUF1015 domain-containing protein [candidate division WOR-3 bacterium]
MAIIAPFAGVRYNSRKVDVRDVVTQPYDKITPSMQKEYYKRSDYNIVRVILPYESENRYEEAQKALIEYFSNDILLCDNIASLYPYHQEFVDQDGNKRIRKGFSALLKLEDFSTGVVLPHERTHSKPKEDRLNLLTATETHLGQIFMLYPDEKNFISKLLAPKDLPLIEIEESYERGVIHKMWQMTDTSIINQVSKYFRDKSVLIADGHHRYETALSYSRKNPSADYVMATFVSTSDPGLVILPTHRALFNTKVKVDQFLSRLSQYFNIKKLDSLSSCSIARHRFTLYIDGLFYNLALRDPSIMDMFVEPTKSPEYKNLDVTVLHSCIIEGILGISKESIAKKENIEYLRDAEKGIEGVDSGRFEMLFLLPATSIDEVKKISERREAMPQKSTDFYPKLLTGLVMYKFG